MIELRVRRIRDDTSLPAAQRDGDAGLDLCAADACVLAPGERRLVPTGIAVEIPPGHAGLVVPRSGRAVREGLSLPNTPGLIDSGYRGELLVPVVNHDRERAIMIEFGDRIAQLVIVAVPAVTVVEADVLSPSERGSAGFGSTGVR